MFVNNPTNARWLSYQVWRGPRDGSWLKPAGANIVYIFLAAAGGGGGGGQTAATGTAKGGGGGGGAGSTACIIMPGFVVPGQISFSLGICGVGGAAGGTATAGAASNLYFYGRNNTLASLTCNVGGVGFAGSAGTGGGAGSVGASASGVMTNLGLNPTYITSGPAGAGGSATTGATSSFSGGQLTCGGSGGGGVSAANTGFAGGAITQSSFPTTVIPQVSGGAINTIGNPGYDNHPQGFGKMNINWSMFSTGGSGGGGSGAGTGGKGGKGGFAGGGGGGGGGITGGAGGDGGDALLIIIAY